MADVEVQLSFHDSKALMGKTSVECWLVAEDFEQGSGALGSLSVKNEFGEGSMIT